MQNAHNSNRKECLAVLKFILDKTDPDTIFAAADTDQSGELSFEELDAAYGKLVGSNDILISDKWFFKYFTHIRAYHTNVIYFDANLLVKILLIYEHTIPIYFASILIANAYKIKLI